MRLSSCTEWLFFHLWKKNPEQNNKSCPGVFIPDTIIYRWGKPYFWYFTTRDGQVLRKTKERIFVENFEDVFYQNNYDGDIIGVSLTSQEIQEKDGKQREQIEFEYYDKRRFKNYVYREEKTFSIVQKFIEPKGKFNQMIKVTWSPQFCFLNRKTNIHQLNDPKQPLFNKIATFEGAEYLTESDSISSPILSNDIEQLCINIVKHIQDVTGGNIQISRMVLYFKLDSKNRIWLQYCTNIKVREKYVTYEHDEPVLNNNNNGQRILSPLLKLNQKWYVDIETKNVQNKVQYDDFGYVKQLRYINDEVCANCSKPVNEMYEIKFGQIIESFDNNILDEETKVIRAKVKQDEEESKNPAIVAEKKRLKAEKEQSLAYNFEEEEQDYYNKESLNIPGLILKLWGKTSEENYKKLKENQSWIQLTTKICDECFLKFTQVIIENKNEIEGKKHQMKLKEDQNQEESSLFRIKTKNPQLQQSQKQQQQAGNQQQTPDDSSSQQTPKQTPVIQQMKKKPKQIFNRQSQKQLQKNPVNSSNNQFELSKIKEDSSTNKNIFQQKQNQIQQQQSNDVTQETYQNFDISQQQQIQTDRVLYSKKNHEFQDEIQLQQQQQVNQTQPNVQIDENKQKKKGKQIKSKNNKIKQFDLSIQKKEELNKFQKKLQQKNNRKKQLSQQFQYNSYKIYNNKNDIKLPSLNYNSNKKLGQTSFNHNFSGINNNTYLSNSNASTMNTQRSQSQSDMKFMLDTIKDLKNVLQSKEFQEPDLSTQENNQSTGKPNIFLNKKQ